MRSLFLKIFLSFWIAQALFLVLTILVTLATRPRENATWEALQTKMLNEAVHAYESGGEQAAHQYFDELQESQHVRAYLFNSKGDELSGGRPSELMINIQRGRERPPSTLWGFPMRPRFLRQSTFGMHGERYTLVMELPPGPRGLFGPRGIPGLGILIALIPSGLVCYVLARYLTAPVVRLRAATQKLAQGDLSARAGVAWKGARRRDEISQLVRDFDTMAERLEGLVKAQSRLLNDISHELRSPLARLNVALALARQRAGGDAQSALERIDLESERLNELIGRLLTVARLEAGHDSLRPVPVDMGELVAEIAKDADFEAQARNTHVRAAVDEDLEVTGDPALLRSAIENVVRNATRYTREGTEVRIQVRREESGGTSQAILTVTDSGPGVPNEALGKLFEPFYRIDDSRGRQTGGVGLGLAITQRVVKLHGGSVQASNRAEGGLLVEIRLPAGVRAPVAAVR